MTVTYTRSGYRKKLAQKGREGKEKVKRGSIPGTTEEPSPDFFAPSSPEPSPIYRFIEDWNRGIIPNNATILNFLDLAATSPTLKSDSRLSPAGLSLVKDFRELALLLRRVIAERNGDELLQRFVGHLRLASRIIRKGQRSGRVTLVEDIPHRRRIKLFGRRNVQVRSEVLSRREVVQNDARQLWKLAQLLLTSTDFRGMIGEIQRIGYRALNQCPVVGPIAVKTSEATGQTVPPVPIEGTIPEEEEELHRKIRQTRKDLDNLRGGGSSYMQQETPLTPQESPIKPIRLSTDTRSSATYYPSIEVYEPESGSQKITTAEDTAGAQPAESSETPIEENKSERDIETEKLLDDMKSLFGRLAGNEEFSSSISGIWSILTRWQKETSQLPGTILPSDLVYDANFAAAQQDFLRLIERFANGASIQPLIQSVHAFQQEARKDYELNDFFMDWRAYLMACISDSAYMDHQEYRRRGRYLLDRTNDYAVAKYRKMFQENLECWAAFLRGWQGDKLTNELGNLVGRIVNQDIFGGGAAGGRGLLALGGIQSSLIADLRDVILPAILQSLYELPLPHIEIEQGATKIALDNIVLPAALFAPADVGLFTRSSIHVSPRQRFFSAVGRRKRGGEGNWKSGTHLSLIGMKGDISNVRFALHRKSFPRIKDSGTLDVRLGGKGLSIAMDLFTDINAAKRRFHVEPLLVSVRIDKLGLKFFDVENPNYFMFARPYLQWMMKRRIEGAICDRIVSVVRFFDQFASRLAKGSTSSAISAFQ